ncbi:methyl-accepting chemotaxis protein [Acidovorax sp. NPDC077664]|uniref:methyl-accepting chemotaxis protein n=2 Tax=unclassified Acidovorax TaxID=2684926 RepID=UPI003CFE7BDD
MTMRAKLGLSFGLMVVLIVLLSAVAIKDMSSAKVQFHDFVTGINARAHLAQEIRSAVDRRAVAARNLVLATKPAERDAEKAAVTKAHEDVQKRLGLLQQAVEGPGIPANVKALVADLAKIEQSYGPVALSIVDLAMADKKDEAIAKINDECRPLLAALIAKTSEYQKTTDDRSQQLVDSSEADFEFQRRFLIGLALLATVIATACGVAITRGVLRALGAEPDALSSAASKVAGGNLSSIAGASAAPDGSVLASLSAMQQNLASIVSKVRGATDSISTGTSEIAMGNADLSQRTEEQASALQQTAATMEEFTSTIRNNAENAKMADQLAISASAVATRGGEVVSKVVTTMRDINDSSRKISDIIGVIDGIAFQTNILALNAAVEAARAGEQGRGFAVVATEVRNLAQRSASAAKEIKALINESVEKVSVGTGLVDQAGQTMVEVVGAIKRVTDIVGEISSASSEQSTGISQIGQAVNQMDHATQQNAALVEQSAAAAKSLEMQAQQLTEAVRTFQLEDSASTAFGHAGSTRAIAGVPSRALLAPA